MAINIRKIFRKRDKWATITYYTRTPIKYLVKTQDPFYESSSDSYVIENTRIPAKSIDFLVFYYKQDSNTREIYKETLENFTLGLEKDLNTANKRGNSPRILFRLNTLIGFLKDLKNMI